MRTTQAMRAILLASATATTFGGKERMGRISKQGDQYLRWLLVAGAMSVIRHARRKDPAKMPAGLVRAMPGEDAPLGDSNLLVQ